MRHRRFNADYDLRRSERAFAEEDTFSNRVRLIINRLRSGELARADVEVAAGLGDEAAAAAIGVPAIPIPRENRYDRLKNWPILGDVHRDMRLAVRIASAAAHAALPALLRCPETRVDLKPAAALERVDAWLRGEFVSPAEFRAIHGEIPTRSAAYLDDEIVRAQPTLYASSEMAKRAEYQTAYPRRPGEEPWTKEDAEAAYQAIRSVMAAVDAAQHAAEGFPWNGAVTMPVDHASLAVGIPAIRTAIVESLLWGNRKQDLLDAQIRREQISSIQETDDRVDAELRAAERHRAQRRAEAEAKERAHQERLTQISRAGDLPPFAALAELTRIMREDERHSRAAAGLPPVTSYASAPPAVYSPVPPAETVVSPIAASAAPYYCTQCKRRVPPGESLCPVCDEPVRRPNRRRGRI